MKKYFRWITSLHLTIICLVGVMVLVLLGTLEQVSTGIYVAQEKYFRSVWVYWQPNGFSLKVPYFPGGYFFSGMLLLNMLAVAIFRFKWTRQKIGILTIHFGIVILILGELVNGAFSTESQMAISEGQMVNYSESLREMELVVIDVSNPEYDQVFSIPESMLQSGKTIKHQDLLFALHITVKFPNSRLTVQEEVEGNFFFSVNRGVGTKVLVKPLAPERRDDKINSLTAVTELKDGEYSLGTWLFSNAIPVSQVVKYRGRDYQIAIRRKRYYYPFSIKLMDFTHETYPGSNIPKHFSSTVALYRDDGELDRKTSIYMNNPLRYDGKTFYQASYGEQDTLSVLQVVDNPGRLLPYFASCLVGLGLFLQFFTHFHRFSRKKRS